MTSFLARVRRLFYGGTISFIITMVAQIFLRDVKYSELWAAKNHLAGFDDYFGLFLVIAPIAYILLVIISCLFIRRKGQFAAFHQQQSFVTSFFRCVGSDITSPFKCIAGFAAVISNRYPAIIPDEIIKKSKATSIFRFVWMMIIVSVCAFGTFRMNNFIALIQMFAK